jgi:drug/metabolite transporter (DMT)-like permease
MTVLPPDIVAVVLLAAMLHAGWNVAVRAGSDRRREAALMLGGGVVLAVVLLPFLPVLPAAAWPYVLISSLLNGAFFILVAEAYAHGGVALAYPLMRGVAPMLTLITSWLVLGEALPALAWAGIAAICGGVVGLARRRGDVAERRAARLALANAVVISAYTLNDAVGVRLSHTPLTYTLWMFPLSAIPTLLWLRRSTSLRMPSGVEAVRGICGAGASIGAYTLVLWAMTRAPVAPVAALRETSILLGVVLARLFLGERPGRRGWGGAVAIAAGAALLRLA